jgi:hypothetical protein
MKKSILLPTAITLSVVSLLAACGGGDGGSSAPAVGWASPAYIVPAGAASKSIPLSNCSGSAPTATLVVNSAGDMVVTGAPTGTTTISELVRVNYAAADVQYVVGTNGPAGPAVLIFAVSNSAEAGMQLLQNPSGGSFSAGNANLSVNCSLTNGSASFALTTLPSSARVANYMTNGITGIDTTYVPGTFTGGVATWDNGGSSLPSDRFVNYNVNTGAIGTAASAAGPFAATAITIPTTPTSTNAIFYELNDSGTKTFAFGVERSPGNSLSIAFSRIGNLLLPGGF